MIIHEFKNEDKNYTLPNDGEYLDGLRKLNIFVGANNSGKSRFMRQMFKNGSDKFVFFYDKEGIFNKLQGIYTKLHPQFGDLYFMEGLKKLIDNRTGDFPSRFNDFYHSILNTTSRSRGTGNVWDLDVSQGIMGQMITSNIWKPFKEAIKGNIRHVYIPILRGLRHLLSNGGMDDLYAQRTVIDYKLDESKNEKNLVFSGLTLYQESKEMLLGSKKGRQFIRDFEKFISESFFSGKNVTLVPDNTTSNIKLNINDGAEDREIYNLGDGIQSILINTFQAFKNKEDELILFIEEPEIFMHPAMQRVLIETLIKKFTKLQIFLTTHSNHFLDLTYDYPGDVAIFSFEEIGKEKFEIKNIGSNARVLDLLGIRNSSVFLANSVIWTEGVTDRMLLREILKLDKSFDFVEDHHYTFAEYGGGNIENFNFVDTEPTSRASVLALSRTNFIIADNDNKHTGPKFERREKLKKALGQDNVFDKHIEIENLIPYKIWSIVAKKILQDHPEKEIKLKELRRNVELKFDKGLNSKKIGILLKNIVEKKEGADPAYLERTDVGCLGETKKIISEYIIAAIKESGISLSDFPMATQELVGQIKRFVALANKKPGEV